MAKEIIAPGTFVPFLLGMPSVKAQVLGLTPGINQYVLLQEYFTQDKKGDQ